MVTKCFSKFFNKARDTLVEKGPIREENLELPWDANDRHFPYAYYSRKTSKEERYMIEKWLVYSKHLDRAFCFCCKLFNSNKSKSSLGNDGFRDGRLVNERLREYEIFKVI